jgi:hypothetical protein
MQGNFNFDRIPRKNSNQRPPRGEQQEPKQAQKRGKQWTRENDKREQSEFFNAFQ